MAQTDWGVFCSPGNEYIDKANWAESFCKTIGAQAYETGAESVTWLQIMATGLKWHFVVFLGALVLAILLGSLLGVIRTTPYPWLVRLGNAYVELFRNIPLIIQLFFWARVFPEFLPTSISVDNGSEIHGAAYKRLVNTMPWVIGILGVGLYHAARISEHVRAGIQAIPTGQWNAGFALGMTRTQVYLNTILPVSFRTIWPTLTSEVMNLFKNTSVAFAIGVFNFYFYTKAMNEETSQDLVIMTITTLVYLLLTYSIKSIMARLEDRLRIPGLAVEGESIMNFDFSILLAPESLLALAKGLWFTLQLAVLALIGGMLIGTPLAMMRLSSNRLLSSFANCMWIFSRTTAGTSITDILLFIAQSTAMDHRCSLPRVFGCTDRRCHHLRHF